MRSQILAIAAATAFTTLAPAPAASQVSAIIEAGVNAARSRGNDGRGPIREIIVRPYDARRHGDYRRTGQDWRPLTAYLLGNRYYQQPYRNARPVRVYTYRDNYFLEPRDRNWAEYRSRYQRNDWRRDRDDDRYDRDDDDRYERRDDRYDRDRNKARAKYEAERLKARAKYERERAKDREKYERERAKERERQARKQGGRSNGRW